jgi:Zn finger protein HypA/HybF involved in hydrogenase expression
VSDDSVQEHCKRDAQQQNNQSTTCDSNPSLPEFAEFKASIDDRITSGDLGKHCSSCGDRLEEQAFVCDSCGIQQEISKVHYRPKWWGISVGLFIAISSFFTLNGITFTLAYVFGVSIIVLALLPASVSPAKIRCRNCGELFQEKLGQCPRCN